MIKAIIICSVVAALVCWYCLKAAGKSDYFDELDFDENKGKERN